jgi:ELWxxDGT repeat protein
MANRSTSSIVNGSNLKRRRRELFFENLEVRKLLAVDFQLVKDINALPDSFELRSSAEVGGVLFMEGSTATSFASLWKTDGTILGTSLVKDFGSSSYASQPENLTTCKGRRALEQRWYGGQHQACGGHQSGSNRFVSDQLSEREWHVVLFGADSDARTRVVQEQRDGGGDGPSPRY